MKTYTSIYKNTTTIFSLLLLMTSNVMSQDVQNPSETTDTSNTSLHMDATYDRPFLSTQSGSVSIGGYLEANSIHTIEEGISEGLSFQARRLTLFFASSLAKRLSFLSEIEIEDGGESILIEFASLDFTMHPMLNFRGGVVMNPIGAFNQNHDGPKWEFVERPDVGVKMLPATWSNAGFGIYGKTYHHNWTFGYEAYLTNGFDEQVIDNEFHKTYLPASKTNRDRFEVNFSGYPLTTIKLAARNKNLGELGLSYMGGRYNKRWDDGLEIAPSHQSLHTFAVDIDFTIPATETELRGEAVKILVDVPESYTQHYGNHQQGFYLDIVQPLLKKPMFGWEKARFNIASRIDYVDWNVGTFRETGTNIGDHQWAVTPAVSFRPSGQTVFRINYRYQWTTDILSNPAEKSASWLLGFSTYF